ncbi:MULTISPECIES: hypothetical protein [Nocardiopsis]|uniref:DUF2273 domain-containing protein n=1 Tax=Nocardiopsis lambiniae TaxID=3075539 RepID=A0ABU2MD02_9ACTN|nr:MULTISPECIES: hypothetical protein [unclassified Nocardiopsis]MDE3723503.1 hypothetical protein [Nocardiopsis sp. N85]MDT0329796.1 hypothetical protein [Nocardiopsis sp. DSM 44743]
MWPIVGLAFGVVLGLTAAFGGFWALLLVLSFGIAGFLGGRAYAGEVDLAALFTAKGRGGLR